MQAGTPVTGTGKTPDKAMEDAGKKADDGVTYDASITGTVKKDGNRPQPNPIGDYRATLTPQ
jgi:hypothetical protein